MEMYLPRQNPTQSYNRFYLASSSFPGMKKESRKSEKNNENKRKYWNKNVSFEN